MNFTTKLTFPKLQAPLDVQNSESVRVRTMASPPSQLEPQRMNWQRLKEPSFIVVAASFMVLLALLFSRGGSSSVNTRLNEMEKTLQKVEAILSDSLDTDAAESAVELHRKVDAEKLVLELGETPVAEGLADCLAQIDGWIAAAEDQESLQSFKVEQLGKLRAVIKKEVADLHDKALKADTGNTAGEFHAKASQILAFYPMNTSQTVLDEARQISSRHAEVGVRIDVIRRQRYNAWAIAQIEQTIKAINEIATSFKTSDNPKTIDATVKHLGEVDPLLLEPVVAPLYNYAVEQAKGNVNSEQQLELGKRLIDPAIKRKGHGDF